MVKFPDIHCPGAARPELGRGATALSACGGGEPLGIAGRILNGLELRLGEDFLKGTFAEIAHVNSF